MTGGREWWREAVFYQIYPRSFQDSNGDGIGDLEGIIQRLDYLNDGTERSLGIDAIWLSPTFPSPMRDFGYDVSDYRGVHPDFGDMATMDRLIGECHRRGMRLVLDYVPNHTSDQHPWFVEARSARHSAKREWYIWRDPAPDGGRPNNWRSAFGGPAWTFDDATGQFYLHSFLKEQPDLNWRNPEVVQEMHDVLRFWFERGIDGFRIDVMGMIVKHPELADNPVNPNWGPGRGDRGQFLWTNNRNYPDVFPAVKAIRKVFDEYDGRMAVGEVFGSAEEIAAYYGGADLNGLHLAFNFQFIFEQEPVATPWEATVLRRIAANAERSLPSGAQPCFALGNHDRSRFVSRNNADGGGRERARAAALMLLALRNTPFIYYGEEFGMEDVDIPEARLQDPARFRSTGRDPERTPMHWDGTPGRGFSTAEPWLPYGAPGASVADESRDAGSLLSLYRRALRVRKAEPALRRGTYRELPGPESVFAFARHEGGAADVFVAINTAAEPVVFDLPDAGNIVLSTHETAEREARRRVQLPPLGAVWVRAQR